MQTDVNGGASNIVWYEVVNTRFLCQATRVDATVPGHEKVPIGGQVEVPGGGQIEVPTSP